MREFVMDYLSDRLSRRGFLKQVTAAGFSAIAAREVLRTLTPLTAQAAEDPTAAEGEFKTVRGTGGDVLVEQWKAAGVKFVVIGNSSHLSPVYDAFVHRSDMFPILAVEEGVAVAIASGISMATGDVSVAAVSILGAPHCSSNIYNAMTANLPVLLATDGVPAKFADRSGIAIGDSLVGAAAATAKWSWRVSDASTVADVTRRAIKVANTAPGGPASINYPSDVLAKETQATIIPQGRVEVPAEIRAPSDAVDRAARMLIEARSPCMVVGAEAWSSGAQPACIELAELLGIPAMRVVLESWVDGFPTNHPLYVNADYRPNMRFPRDIDLVLAVGGAMQRHAVLVVGGMARGQGSARSIHITTSPDEIGKAGPADLPILADTRLTVEDIAASVKSQATSARLASIAKPRAAEIRAFNRDMQKSLDAVAKANRNNHPISWQRVGVELDKALDDNALIVEEISTEKTKLFSYLRSGRNGRTRIGRGTGQALGWGVGLACGAKLAVPDRQVVGLVGDGAFLFGQCETLWTISRYDVPLTMIVMNNRGYNEPRQRMMGKMGVQGQSGKDMASYLGTPDVDFAKLGAVFDIKGEVVEDPSDLAAALKRARKVTRDGRPYMIDVVVERTGIGRESTWFPAYSAAESRTKQV